MSLPVALLVSNGLAAEVQHPEPGPSILDGLKTLHYLPQANCRAGQSIHLRDDKRIAPAHVAQRAFKFCAFGDRRDLLLENLDATRRLKIADLSLEFGFLFCGGGAGIPTQLRC